MQRSENTKYQRHNQNYWEKHITTWQGSGLTQSEYCKQNKIPLSSFANWKKKININPIPASPFIELKGHLPVSEEHFELEIDSGLTLRIRESIPLELLQNILMAVRGM